MTAIYIVWAVMLWRASDNPAKHSLFIDFTLWANTAHGFVMIIATPIQKGLVMMVIESLPLLVIAAVLWWLRPRRPLEQSVNHWKEKSDGTLGDPTPITQENISSP
jgi:hypothetical protein